MSERIIFAKNENLATVLRAMQSCQHEQAHLIAVDVDDKSVCWCPWCGAYKSTIHKDWQRPVPLRLFDD